MDLYVTVSCSDRDCWRSLLTGIFLYRMLYHASSILLYRLILDPTDIPTAGGHVGTCLEHSAIANQMAVAYTHTFGERIAYVGMYSSFVAA